MPNPLTLKLEQFTRFAPSERMQLEELLQYPSESFRRGKTIMPEGKKIDEIHLVLNGLAARSKTLPDGSRQFMAFLVPGDLCDVEVFVLEAMDHDIIAISDTTCLLIPAERMEVLLTQSSNVTRAMWWSTMTDSAVLRESIVNHGSRDARERIAHLFCELLVRYRIVGVVSDNTIPFPMTQEELAEATGLTAVHVNRVLKQLRTDGLIDLENKMLTVLDFPGLQKAGQFEPGYLHLVRTQKGDPAISERVGDLVPPTKHGVFEAAWDKLQEVAGQAADPG
ncbi:CRP-like cAMP-binding protein [Sphingomonas sp. F9_3S_D5_B_2]